MISVVTKVVDRLDRIEKAAKPANFRNLGHAAASIRKAAAASIVTSPEPSEPGTPPHTRNRNFFRRAIRFDVQENEAVIGFMESMVGPAAAAHEFGGEFRGQDYPARPTMGPALEEALPRLAENWRGTIGA